MFCRLLVNCSDVLRALALLGCPPHVLELLVTGVSIHEAAILGAIVAEGNRLLRGGRSCTFFVAWEANLILHSQILIKF